MLFRAQDRRRMAADLRCFDSKSGFTLLELVVVIFIVSLLAGIVFPSFRGLGRKTLESDARRIASILRYLNDSAISTKGSLSLKVDFGENTITWKGPDGERTETYRKLVSVYLQSRGEVKDGQVTVFFGPLGAQEAMLIRLKDDDGREIRVALYPVSGRVKILSERK